jgi:DNA (cytosine-5)-methyltransferase 1
VSYEKQIRKSTGESLQGGDVRVLDLFSGIGGFSLGLERAGMETVAFCEFDKHARKVLNKHWPNVPVYEDVRELTNERLKPDGITGIDVITGGFPCQDISVAGKQAGIGEGTRSGLWSECARLVREIRPNYAIFENVTALLSGEQGRWFQRVLFDLSQIGYDAEWHCIPASELGAHHHRDRVWIIAYPSELQCNGSDINQENGDASTQQLRSCDCQNNVAYTNSAQRERMRQPFGILTKYADFERASGWAPEPKLGRVANGVPNRSHRLKQLGNSVVPQIPELIGRAIMADQWGGL